jgi:hypothetical protein
MKFYIVAILLAILINGIYPIWATYYTCDNYAQKGTLDSCLNVGPLDYLDFDKQLTVLTTNGQYGVANVFLLTFRTL